jgi:hypothetical protein
MQKKKDLEVINASLYLIVPVSMFIIVMAGIQFVLVRHIYTLVGGAVLIILLSNYLFKMTKKNLQ